MKIGTYHSEETKKKMRKARLERKKRLGYINSPETRERIGEAQKGKKLLEETKRKLSTVLKGRKKPPFTEEHKRKISETLKGKPQPWNTGEKCHFWRGGMMEKIPVKCTICGKINLVRKGWLMKRILPYKCRNCCNKGKKRTLEYRLKSSLLHRKYSLDETFFEKIDSEEKAYWLGFLSGDGFITAGNKIRLSLGIKDKRHLKKFKEAVKWTGKDYFHKDTNGLEVYFRSLKMMKDLARYSITQRKTFTIKFPNLPKSFERHFIRGVFDADGCICRSVSTTRGKSGQLYIYHRGEFDIQGNKEFILATQSRFVELGLSRNSINYSGKKINRIRYGGINQLKIIYKYLYENATVFLERKKELFKDILKNYHSEVIRPQRKEFRLPKVLEMVK